jgi:putative transcriptional regulator
MDDECDPFDHEIDPLDQPNEKGPPEATLISPPVIEKDEIRALRKRLRLTQRQFAAWFGFAVGTLRHWERGNRRPTGTALVLLNLVRDNPRAVRRAVVRLRRWDPRSLAGPEPRGSHRAPPGYRRRVY